MEILSNLWCVFQENIVLQLFTGAILGTIFSILTTIFIEKIRSPKLNISIAEDGILYNPPGKRKHLILQVINKKFKILPRYPALNCTGKVTFHNINNDSLLISKPISIRWQVLSLI